MKSSKAMSSKGIFIKKHNWEWECQYSKVNNLKLTLQIINLLIKYKIVVVVLVLKTGQCPLSGGVDMMTADSDAGTPATEFLI